MTAGYFKKKTFFEGVQGRHFVQIVTLVLEIYYHSPGDSVLEIYKPQNGR